MHADDPEDGSRYENADQQHCATSVSNLFEKLLDSSLDAKNKIRILKLVSEHLYHIMSQYACKRNIIFYHKVVEAVIAILSGTAPCLILENPTQQLRKGALDLVSNIGAKRLKLLQPDLLQRFFNVLICLYDEDNEDNFLSGLKIILDVFKSESLPEGLIVLCQRLLLVFKYKVTDVNIRESRTSYASVKERHVWMGREIVTILPKASESLCVIAEAPELILLTLHLWSKGSFYFGIVNDISNVCLKIINFLPDEESRHTRNFNLDTFTIILKMQINILRLLAHIYRIHLSLEKNLRTEEFAIHFFSGLIHLLKNCPANSEFLREKVLNVLSMSLKMSLKKGLSMHVRDLLVDSYLYNTESDILKNERVLYFTILLKYFDEIIPDLNKTVMELITKTFLPIICDLTLPIQIHVSLCDLLMKFSLYLQNKKLLLDMIHSFSERLEFLIMKEMSCIIKMPKEYNTFFDEKCTTAMLYSTSKINRFAGEDHLSNFSLCCILQDSSNEKSVKDFGKDLRINDCKRFMKIIIECAMTFVKLLKTDVKENQVSEAPLDYVQPFSKLLGNFLVAVFIFKIPNTSHGVKEIMLQEEKDVLIELAKVFHHFSPEEFCQIFLCNMNIILYERSRNPALQIFLQSLFVDSSKTRLLSVIFLNFILVCAKQFDNKNNFPILSCLLNDVLRAMLKFPQNADLLIRFLQPFINRCIAIIPSAELPGNFLRVIVSLMVVIKAGHFENIFNSLALYLSTILRTMNTWYRTSIDQSFQDQVLEVCLSIAMNCNSEILMSNFQSILTPVVYALNRNNSDLVLKALKVLQAICHLNNRFINSLFLSLRMELVQGLHHALKIPSDQTKEIIFQLLIRFHDHRQNFQIQKMQHEKIHSKISENSLFEEWLCIAKYFLATYFNLDYRHLMIQFSRIDLKKKQHFPGCALLKFRHINNDILKNILAVISRTPHPPAADDFFQKYFSHWVFLSFCGEFDLFTNSEEIRTEAVNVIDLIVDFVSCHSSYDVEIKDAIKTGIMSLDILIQNSEILMKEISNNSIWELSFFNYMIQKISHLLYKNKLQMQLFGCKAIELLFKMFSVNTRCIYATEFLEHLLYLIEDLTIEGDCNSLNFGTLSQVKHTIALIVSFLFERQTLELDIKPFLKVFVMHIASPSEDVRIVVKSHLENFCKALNKDLCRLLEPIPELFPSYSQIGELLKCLPLKSKIGIIDSYAFFAPINKYGTVNPSQHAKNLIYLAGMCSEVINNEFYPDSKDCIYYIKLCQVAFKVFCYFSFECCTAVVLDQSIDRDWMLDYYFSNFQHMYAMQQSHTNDLSLLFVSADHTHTHQTTTYRRCVKNFIVLIKEFLIKINPVNFSEEPDYCIFSHTKEALCSLGERTAILIKSFMNDCLKEKPNEENKELFLILSGFLNCHPERNLRYFYYKYLGACHLKQKICLISYLENSLGVRWNKAMQEIFLVTKLPHERAVFDKDFVQLITMLSSEAGQESQSRTGYQHSSQKALPNEETCYAIEILIYLKEHNVDLYQNKEIIWLLQKSWITINNSLSENIRYNIQLREFRQLVELLLEVYKSSAKNELLFDLLRAPIEQLPHLNFITDFLNNVLAERNYKNLEEIFLSFIHYYNEKKYSSDVNVRIVEFLLIPSLIFSMKKADFKISEQMIDGVLICFDLKVAELNLKYLLLQFSCLILEWASHNINNYFLKKLKDYVKKRDFQIEKKYFHPSLKDLGNLFWIYLFKVTETKLNKDFVCKVLQNSLEAYRIDVQEINNHVLDILTPAICSDIKWRSYFTHWAQMILEEEILSNVCVNVNPKKTDWTQEDFQIFSTKASRKRALDDNLRFKRVCFLILNHPEAYDVMNFKFVSNLLKGAITLFKSSVVEEKQLAVEIIETLFKCAEKIYNKENLAEGEEIAIKNIFQMCGDLLIQFTNVYLTDGSSEELHKRGTEILKRIFGLFSLDELITWFTKMDPLSIYNQLEFMNYLLSNHQDQTFGFVLKFIPVLLDSLSTSKVSGLFEKLIKEFYEYAEVKLCDMPLSIKAFLEAFFEVIELVLKRTMWQPLYVTINWDDFLKPLTDFPHLISSITSLFDKIAKSLENILSKVFKLSIEKYLDNSMNCGILAFLKFIDTWLNNFLLSEISKPDIAIPNRNPCRFREFTNKYMLKCMIESLGWLILRLVINIYPKYLHSMKYINVLEKLIKNYLKLFSSDDREGTQRIYLRDTKIIMTLEIIELGCCEIMFCDRITDLLLDLIKKTSSKAILSIIMNIIYKYCVCIDNHNHKGKIQRLIQELAARIGQKFPNDTEICDLYFKIIEIFWFLFYRNSEIRTIRNDFSKISFKSENHDTQQKFFCLFNKIVSNNISEQMVYLTSESYWQHTTSFYFAPCVQLIISCVKDDPRLRLFFLGSMNIKKRLSEDSMHSSEYSNNADFYRNYDQKTQILLKTLDSFKIDLKKLNFSYFYTAVQKSIEFDDNVAKLLWNRLLPKIFSVLNEHDKRYIATLIEGFVQRELAKNKGIKHTKNVLSFSDIHLKNPELSLVTHSFLEFAVNFPNLRERCCLRLEDSCVRNYSCSVSNCKKCLKVQLDVYSILHENDLTKILLEERERDEMSHSSIANFRSLVLSVCQRKKMVHLTKLTKKKSLLFFPQIDDANTKDPIRIKCLEELGSWSNLRIPDATIDYSSNISTEIMKTFDNMKTLFLDEKASLVMVSDSIKNLVHLCIENMKQYVLPPHAVTEKYYSLLKFGKKIANLEEAHLFQKLLSNHNYVNNISNLMKILESWCYYAPFDNDLSFWEDIFVVRLCLLQCLPVCISTNFCKDKAKISELKYMAQLTYNVLQLKLASMHLSQGFPKKCTELLNCIRVKSMTMNKHMLPLYMDSVFLQIEQCDNDVQFKDLLKHASSFLKSNLRQPMEKDQKSMYFIYDKEISALQKKGTVAKEVFHKPLYTSYDESIGWIYCGKYFQKIYKPGDAKTNLKFAMQCFLQACRYKNEANYGDLIPRILWILSNDDLSLKLLYTFLTDGGLEISTSCWLPWIPQLLNAFCRSKVCNLSCVLYSIGRKYPSSLYFLLNIFIEKIASKRDKQEHKKCLEKILHHMEEEHPELCFTLKNIKTEFLKIVQYVNLNMHDVLKSIESEICDILYQRIAQLSNVDVESKISEIICKKFSYFEGRVDSNIRIILSESIELLSKSRDLIGFLNKFSEWIAYYEQREKRTFPLERISKFLSTYHLHQKKVDMLVNSYSKPSSIQISRFLPTVEIIEGACQILIQGDNGKVYPYLISHNMDRENIFREDRIFQFFALLNSLLRDSLHHSLQIKIPTFVCIHPCLKVFQSVASTYSLLDIYNQHCTTIEQQNLVIPGCLSLFANLYLREEFIQNVDKSYTLELFEAVQNHIPKNMLKEAVAQSADDYIVARRTFAKNFVVIGLSRFFFFLNKQSPEKLFINLCSGEVLPFGLNFDLTSADDDQVTFGPLQLTENISEFIGPLGISGYVGSTVVKCVQSFYKHIDKLESFLQILLLEELEDTNSKYRPPCYHSRIIEIICSITQNIKGFAEISDEDFMKTLCQFSSVLNNTISISPSAYPGL